MDNPDTAPARVGREGNPFGSVIATLMKQAAIVERIQKSMTTRAFGRDIGADALEAFRSHEAILNRLRTVSSRTENMTLLEANSIGPYMKAITELSNAYYRSITIPMAQPQSLSLDQELIVNAQDLLLRQQKFNRTIGPLGATAQLSVILAAVPRAGPVADFAHGLEEVARAYAELAARSELVAEGQNWLLEVPPLFSYTGSRALSAMLGLGVDLINAASDTLAEVELGETRDTLVARLHDVDAGLAEIYRGAMSAMLRREPDWVRHVSTSLRELLIHLIDLLAPTPTMDDWKTRTKEDTAEGGWSRKAKLRFIFRAGRQGGTERMVDNMIESIVMLIYPTSDGVHALISPHNEDGMTYIVSHSQGVLATVLTAAGY